MSLKALAKRLKPLEEPIESSGLKWLYLHFPPQPIRSKKRHRIYAEMVSLLMRELEAGTLGPADRTVVATFLESVIPFIETYERVHTPVPAATPEDMLRFLMEQHALSQYDLAEELGGQPVVSDVLHGKRRLSRDHIERLSRRFHTSPAAFYPAA